MILADSYGTALLSVGAAVWVAGLIGLWFLSRLTPRGTTLMVAIAIYLLGVVLTMADLSSREAALTSGLLKLLGFTGGMFGLVDAVRSREPRGGGPPPIAGISPVPPADDE